MAALKVKELKPLKGRILAEPQLGQYETESGLLVVKDLKKNPKVDKVKVIAIGEPYDEPYAAQPGEFAWVKRGVVTALKKVMIEGKLYCFIRNEDIVASL